MSTHRPRTEEHNPPTTSTESPGVPALLGAFPAPIFLPFPKTATTIGRDDVTALGHTDSKISTQHVRLWKDRQKYFIEDLGSRNGTFVNRTKLAAGERRELEDGDVVRLAVTIFVFRESYVGGPAPARPIGQLVGPWGLSALRETLNGAVPRLFPDKANVLIEGETGVGKELLAPEVAKILGRDLRRYAGINVASFPDTMFDAQLFGWEKGGFTGATGANPGIFRQHEGGAVFLDEIGDLPPALQPKLLRLLENREVVSLGARGPVPVKLTVIGATNKDLDGMVKGNDFRADLLARFPVRLSLPPLADRSEDLFSILARLWERRHPQVNLASTRVDAEAIELLMHYNWPANVRDVDRMLTLIDPAAGIKLSTVNALLGDKVPASVPNLTKESIQQALQGRSQEKAAKVLGIGRSKLVHRMRKLGI
ncbi:MAG: sigma 54-interacting transcriptional regulator [Polyangiaceae bacterium]